MNEHSDAYIAKCLELGILTKAPIRKYPLRAANLGIVLKAYALTAHKSYTLNNRDYSVLAGHNLYLTDDGLAWLYESFRRYTFAYLRSTFQFVFSKATPDDIVNLETYEGMRNFQGTLGDKPKAGSKRGAVLVRSYGKDRKITKEFIFESIVLARKEALNLTRYYPADEFKLYALRPLKPKADGSINYCRVEIPLVLPPSMRGVHSNLPNVR